MQSIDSGYFGDGRILGCDFAGTVCAIGSDVTRYKPGDKVAGLIWGGEKPRRGAYSSLCIADEAISFPIPRELTLDQAATVPLALCTSVLALFAPSCLALAEDGHDNAHVLVLGSNSSVGQYAIQLLRLCGIETSTTASPTAFDTVMALGAQHVYSYHDPAWPNKAVSAQDQRLITHVFDTIGREGTSASGARAGGKKICTVRPGKAHTEDVPEDVEVTDVLVWTAFLSEHRYGTAVWPASHGDYALCKRWFAKLPGLLSSGKVVSNKVKMVERGLDGVEGGFELYRKSAYSGEKIVYEVKA